MKHLLLAIIFASSAWASSGQALPANHVDLTSSIIEFLSRTELCLNSCCDAESAKAAVSQLQQLKEECDKLVEIQQNLPEPTIQDYMAVQNQMEAFNTVWNAIRDHIERLEADKIMTQEMRDILHIAPPDEQKP